jgi:class 3 adenylate cyclase
MEKYCEERFLAQRRMATKIAPFMEVNDILEKVREELRGVIPSAMEVCILLLDPEAEKYTRPLQCALYERPVSCLACKRDRPAIQKAILDRKGVVVSKTNPVVRPDNSLVLIGPEAAIPVFVDDKILAVVSVVSPPETQFTRKDFYILRDCSEMLSNVLLNAKKQWEITQEKIRINQMLTHLSPFVPESVRRMVEKNPEMLNQEKEKKDVSVLFLDLEGYTRLSASRPDTEVNEVVERMFSSFVDPIHRSHGDINETAGDALMIIFKDYDATTNAINSVKAAFEIFDRNREINRYLGPGFEPIEVNIGINSGSALVGMTRLRGSLDTRMTYTASGPVTNMASRLADYAKGGDILIGEETRTLIDGLWPVYDRGTAELKGIQKPMRIYSLLKISNLGDEKQQASGPTQENVLK